MNGTNTPATPDTTDRTAAVMPVLVATAIAETLTPTPTATSGALIAMARRYGQDCLEMGRAEHDSPEYRRALRAIGRRYGAMLRLIAALTTAGGVR